MSSTKEKVMDDIKTAMKAKDKERLGTLRLISSAIKQREVDDRIELDDDGLLAVLEKMVKQRKESITQYKEANREDLLAVEEAELVIIREYMPEAMPAAEVESMIRKAIDETGASSMKDMGKVMGILKGQLQGRADMSEVSSQIKAMLS